MRLLHTADWHLGRILHGARLIEDQAHILDQIVGVAREARPDAVLIAGDVYDRAVPPPEAVELLEPGASVRRRTSPGGAGPGPVAEQRQRFADRLRQDRQRVGG